MYFLIIMLGMALGVPQDDPQDMYFNHLNISLGINYKHNGYCITTLTGYGGSNLK